MTAMFVNLPVTDLERAKAFYAGVGFALNPMMSDHNAACFVVEEDHSYLMVLVREYFQTFTDKPLGDPAVSPSVSVAVFLDSRDWDLSRSSTPTDKRPCRRRARRRRSTVVRVRP